MPLLPQFKLFMPSIEYKILENEDVHILEDMCNKLMKFQAQHASFREDILADMNFNNRFLPDHQNASYKYVLMALAGKDIAGFAFATSGDVIADTVHSKPAWASDLSGTGFYPVDYDTPKRIGTFKLLYVDDTYRGFDIGRILSEKTMEWLKSHSDVDDLWVYVANGNESVARFYEKFGFEHSHEVFSGFIDAYVHPLK